MDTGGLVCDKVFSFRADQTVDFVRFSGGAGAAFSSLGPDFFFFFVLLIRLLVNHALDLLLHCTQLLLHRAQFFVHHAIHLVIVRFFHE